MAERAALPLPLSLDEVDGDWLSAALRAQVRGVEVVDVKNGTCTKVRLRLDLDPAARAAGLPELMILKTGFEPHSRDMAYMHETEVRGYRDLLPGLGLPIPACFFADYDPERRQGAILMEDLVARDVRFCHALKPESYEAVARRLTVLAQFHARSWNAADLAPGGRWDWLAELNAATEAYAAHYLQPEVWRRFIAAPRAAAASARFHDPRWMAQALAALARLAAPLPHAVLHGDTHLGNLYVDPDGAPGFFDALPHRGPVMAEVSYHLACALDLADRPRWERALVAHYLAELARAGASDVPDLDEAMAQYAAFLARAYFIFVINDAAFQDEAINTAYVARISAAMLQHDTIGRLRQERH